MPFDNYSPTPSTDHIKLSIIITCFNAGSALRKTLDSVLMQKTDFNYEVIVIDDASMDSTGEILKEYSARDRRVRVITNENKVGSVTAFNIAAKNSQGDYLCVLDCGDFYTIKDKLQRQVDFLDRDKGGEYAAVAHKYLVFNRDGTIKEDTSLFEPVGECTYYQFISQKHHYSSSTLMYRNVFRESKMLPSGAQSGEVARTLIAMKACCGKIKILNFVGSAQAASKDTVFMDSRKAGMDSSGTNEWDSCSKYVETNLEKRLINGVPKSQNLPDTKENKGVWTIDAVLEHLSNAWANTIVLKESDFVFRKLYKSDFIDSFCESLGFIKKEAMGLSPNKNLDDKKVALVISVLNRKSGGVYQEILELVTMLQSRKITIFLTEMASLDEFTDEMRKDFAAFSNVSFVFLKGFPDRLSQLMTELAQNGAARIYWYCAHNNTWANAALQNYGAQNVVPFSYDHGLSLGLVNTNIDQIITKTPKDYKLLAGKFGDRVIYVPCWSIPAKTEKKYLPLQDHNSLNTATAAARFYKYEGDILGNYVNFIASLLKITGGKHFHYGPLPKEVKTALVETIKRNRGNPANFIHIEWANNLPDSMLENSVDLFISPFPITSIKLSLQCISAGVPVLAYAGGDTRIEQNDFLNPDVLKWRNRKEFFETVLSMSKEKLMELSISGIEYFKSHNDLAAAMPYVLLGKGRDSIPIPPHFVDDRIIDVDNILDLIMA